jgi:hypothetical protein
MNGRLTPVSRWLFLAVFLYAPWAYGCTRDWTISLLEALIAAAALLRLAGWAFERDRPQIPWVCLALSALLLAQGWLMTANAHGLHDEYFHLFIPLQSAWEHGPGSIDRPTSLRLMLRASALLCALCLSIDLAHEAIWRVRLLWAMLVAGASVIGFGLVERILGAPMVFWEEGRVARTFFATYVYHGNAGSFINLVLPAVAVLTVDAFREPEAYWQRAVCVPALLVTIAGAFVNLSKAAMLISCGLLLALVLWQVPGIARAWTEGAWGRVLAAACALLLALAVLVAAGGWKRARDRWEQLPQLLRNNPREKAAQIALSMTQDSRWWGFGAGTFEDAFPHYSNPAGNAIEGIWRYAHEDYLQTAVEWGWVGAAWWGVLYFGGLGLAANAFLRGGRGEGHIAHLAAALALSAAALHALVDFPFQIASLQLYLMAYLGMGWSTLIKQPSPSARRTRLRSRRRPSSSSNSNQRHSPSAGD